MMHAWALLTAAPLAVVHAAMMPQQRGGALQTQTVAPGHANASTNQAGPSIFVYVVIVENEVPLVRSMLDRDVFVQGSDTFRVYGNLSSMPGISDHAACVGCYEQAIEGSMSVPRGGVHGTRLNSAVFLRVFEHIFATDVWRQHQWTVKIDADAVWMPQRLRGLLSLYDSQAAVLGGNTNAGCSRVYGPIEILSHAAMEKYSRAPSLCDSPTYNSMFGEDDTLMRCMNRINVSLAPMPLMLSWATVGHCSGCEVVFHPFKTSEEWEACHTQLTADAEAQGPIDQCAPRVFDDQHVQYLESIAAEIDPLITPAGFVNWTRCNAMTRERSLERFAQFTTRYESCEHRAGRGSGFNCTVVGGQQRESTAPFWVNGDRSDGGWWR